MVVVFLILFLMFFFGEHGMFCSSILLTRRLGGETKSRIDQLHITSRTTQLLLVRAVALHAGPHVVSPRVARYVWRVGTVWDDVLTVLHR